LLGDGADDPGLEQIPELHRQGQADNDKDTQQIEQNGNQGDPRRGM
jgi:hypothetical protein